MHTDTLDPGPAGGGLSFTGEGLLQQMLENSDLLVVVKDADLKITRISRRLRELFARAGLDPVGRTMAELLPAAEAAEIEAHDRQVLTERRAREFEESYRIDGQRLTFLATRLPLYCAEGRPCGLCTISTDITDRKRTEDALRNVAVGVSGAQGEAVYRQLAQQLAATLGTEMAMIGTLSAEDPQRVRSLAVSYRGEIVDNLAYELPGTPCAHVIGRTYRFIPDKLLELYPDDAMMRDFGFASYAGYPLFAADGRELGLIVVADPRPLRDATVVESILKIFSVRAAAEIERAEADRAREISEASYREIFEASEDCIFVHDIDTGAILDVNRKTCDSYGYTREEIRRLDIGQLSSGVPPYTLAEAAAFLARARAGETVRTEWHRRNKDGSLHWDEVVMRPATLAGTRRLLVFTREITDRKRAEAALRAREEQYRAVFNASADALLLWSPAGRLVDANPAYEAMSGYSREQLLTMDPLSRIHPDSVADVRAFLEALTSGRLAEQLKAGHSFQGEYREITAAGRPLHLEYHGTVFDYLGQPHVLMVKRDVTERKHAEQALKASEEQYRAIFNASVDGLMLWNRQGRIVDVNPAYSRMHGFSRAELLSMDPRGFIHPDSWRQFDEFLTALTTGRPFHALARDRRKDGSEFEVEVNGIPMVYRGEPHLLGIVRDISERRRQEAALRASEEQYRAIFNASVDGMVLWSPEGEMVDVNPAFLAMYGYSREELFATPPRDMVHPDSLWAFDEFMARLKAGVRPGDGRTPLISHAEIKEFHKSGEVLWLDVQAVAVEYQGRPHVLAIKRDIGERKRREAALKKSQDQLRATVEAGLDCIISMDARGRILEFNPAAEATFGHRRDAVLGRELAELLIPPDMRERHRQGLERHQRTGRGPFLGRRIEVSALRADGSQFPAELAIAVTQGPEGDIFVAYLRDITERRAAEAERGRLEAQLRQAQKMEAIGHLTGGIAHDFNNILTSILGYAVLAEERPRQDPKLGQYLEQIRVSGERARDLIRQMLTFSRGQRGEARPLLLPAMVMEAVKLYGSTFPSSIEFETELDAGVPAVMLDPIQFEQVLMNLCINARDAMDGVGRIRIAVAERRHVRAECSACRKAAEGDFVELEVTDTGAGIAPEVLERMFEPFFTTKDVGQGSGMGLATTHGIVHEHGGHIVVETEPGQGTRFRVLFPAALARVAEYSDLRGDAGTDHGAGAGRLLVVDDEGSMLAFMEELLASRGFQVFTAGNGQEALDRLSSGELEVDLVITDQTMPRLTGLQLADAIAQRWPRLPVVLYTGYSDRLAEDRWRQSKVRAKLRKPVDLRELFETIHGLLNST